MKDNIHTTLKEIAYQAMKERGLWTEFSLEVKRELEQLPVPAFLSKQAKDLRHFEWVSIDNIESQDLDQLTYAKENGDKDELFVAIADVDAIVKRNSAIDQFAKHNTTSVYTPTQVFPMLPFELSHHLTSLCFDEDRLAIVVAMTVTQKGEYELNDIFLALVHNHAKLAYPTVGPFLETGKGLDISSSLQKQLQLQDRIASRIEAFRSSEGALGFETIELEPIVINESEIQIKKRVMNRAHKIIENCMIAANVCVSRYCMEWNLPILRRIVRTPKRWQRIVDLAKSLGVNLPKRANVKALRDFLNQQRETNPLHFSDLSLAVIKLLGRGEYVLGKPDGLALGHFDLALRDYAHTTAPNRRFPDLVMQRILKSHLYGVAVEYRSSELTEIAMNCTQKEDDAMKVERQLIKCLAAIVLVDKIGSCYRALVTGASPKGTWARVLDPPIEGKIVRGFKGLDVGDWIDLELIRVDIHNGHIDFAVCRQHSRAIS